jgi:hypothetical protein
MELQVNEARGINSLVVNIAIKFDLTTEPDKSTFNFFEATKKFKNQSEAVRFILRSTANTLEFQEVAAMVEKEPKKPKLTLNN